MTKPHDTAVLAVTKSGLMYLRWTVLNRTYGTHKTYVFTYF